MFLGIFFQIQFRDRVKWDEESESEEKIWKKIGLWAQIGLLWKFTTLTPLTKSHISPWNILQKFSKIYFFNLKQLNLIKLNFKPHVRAIFWEKNRFLVIFCPKMTFFTLYNFQLFLISALERKSDHERGSSKLTL